MAWIRVILCALLLQGCTGLNQQDPRDASAQWQDQQLEMDINGLAQQQPFKTHMDINAIVISQSVLLIGQSQSKPMTEQFLNLVEQIPSIHKIYNQIEEHAKLPIKEVTKDTWITTRLKTEMIASKQLSDVAIKVITENNIVYLLGYVNNNQADIATHMARNIPGVKKVVRLLKTPNNL